MVTKLLVYITGSIVLVSFTISMVRAIRNTRPYLQKRYSKVASYFVVLAIADMVMFLLLLQMVKFVN